MPEAVGRGRPLRRLSGWLYALGAVGTVTPALAALPPMPILPASFAVEAAEAALHDCIGRGFHVAVAVVDRSGSLRVLIADEHVRDIDIESARRKAHTAAVLDSATAAIADAVDHVPAYGRLLTDLDSALIFVGGGLPIHASHDLVGAIAVGGAPGGYQDASCAGAGIDAIAARLK